MSTAEINAYLDWRAEREGKTVDVSPEAYEKHHIIGEIFEHIAAYAKADHVTLGGLEALLDLMVGLVNDYKLLEEN